MKFKFSKSAALVFGALPLPQLAAAADVIIITTMTIRTNRKRIPCSLIFRLSTAI